VALALGACVVAASPTQAALLVAAGAIVAASLPDIAEGVLGYGPTGQRFSIIPHRTATHFPWPYLAVMAISFWIPSILGIEVAAFVRGLALGALLHLFLDAMSPAGIPLLRVGERRSFGLFLSGSHPYIYRTGTIEEWRVLLPAIALTVVYVMTRWPTLTSAVAAVLRF
jgi:inner membrane protein